MPLTNLKAYLDQRQDLSHDIRETISSSSQLNALGFCFTLATSYLAWLSWAEQGVVLAYYLTIMGFLFLFYGLSSHYCNPNFSISIKTVLFWGVVFRLIGFFAQPIYEDDFHRYLWDGYRFANDGTPYSQAPEFYFNDLNVPQRFQKLLDQINHPDIPTIYAPTFQYIFLLAHWLAPGELWSLKLLLIAADIGLIAVLLKLTNPQRALLYAWNPLVIKEIAITAHPDGLLPTLLLSCWLFHANSRQLSAGLFLAASVCAKASAGLLAPFLLIKMRAVGRLAFFGGLIILYAPFLWVGGKTDLSGLQAFAQGFEFNSALYGLLTLWITADWSKKILGLVYLLLVARYFFNYWKLKHTGELPHGEWLFGGLLLVAPVINPWYLLWALPFACIYPCLTILVATAAIQLAYVCGLNLDSAGLGPYEHPLWLRPLEFGIIGGVLIWEMHTVHLYKDRLMRVKPAFIVSQRFFSKKIE